MSWKFRFQNRVSGLPPRLNLVVTRIVLTGVRISIRILQYFAPDRYTDADPYTIRYVDPNKITHISGQEGTKRRGWAINGDWDQRTDRFLDLPIPNAIEQHFNSGIDWEETTLADQYDDAEKFQQKCEHIERLHEIIATQGYWCQRELLNTDPEAAWSGVNTTISPLTNEVTVDIGRDGEILFNMLGKHRLSIAKVIGVDEIPVLVFCRHTNWQQIRALYKFRETNNRDEHPDLVDLQKESQTQQ